MEEIKHLEEEIQEDIKKVISWCMKLSIETKKRWKILKIYGMN
jgi:hypothetical protein